MIPSKVRFASALASLPLVLGAGVALGAEPKTEGPDKPASPSAPAGWASELDALSNGSRSATVAANASLDATRSNDCAFPAA
ncbi:MAG: hypothetical protein IPM54_40335 [Polyangiaceae bacterium]|nr:hypothetical protein [Polyangiaceae bacterium]